METLNTMCRVVHLVSTGFLTGCITLNYFFKTNDFLAHDDNFLDFANPLAALFALVSGAASIFLLKPPKQVESKPLSKVNGAKK